MLTKMFEWYRVVNSSPNDETVQKRTSAAKDLVTHLKKSAEVDTILSCVAGVVNGFDVGFDQKSEVIKLVVGLIRKHQPAFPEDLAENALELRVLAAVAFGELLSSNQQRNGNEDPILAASLFVSALPLRPPAKAKHLQSIMQELNNLAMDVLERNAVSVRSRDGLSFEDLGAVDGADVATFREALLPAIRSCMEAIQAEAEADREELNVLWWMYTGYSKATGRALSKLKPGEVCFSCGGELAELVLLPPGHSPRQMVRRVIADNTEEKAEISIKKIVADCDTKTFSLLTPDESKIKKLIQSFPMLFPLSWLSSRLIESAGAAGWGEEFTLKTGIPNSRQLSMEEWGIQVFNERITQRTYFDIVGDEK